ncbi:MAG: glutathione synthase [Candidatus Omnitrophota bacterium]
MNFLFLMDPLETIKIAKDTTFRMMLESYKRGHNVFYVPDGGILLKDGRVQFHVNRVKPQKESQQPFVVSPREYLWENDADIVFIRNDPPFDERYLFNTWLLDRVIPQVPIVNSLNGIRCTNEKLWATRFASIVPSTLVSCVRSDLLAFIDQEKEVIAKPTNSFGGSSVFYIKRGDTNTNVILETLSEFWSKEIILQQYIPEAKNGDKRILLLDGEVLGAVLRVHAEGDHRNNFFSGGKGVGCDITKRDQEIINTLKSHLKSLGLYLVGLDLIGDYLTEVNVTSPTCLVEMNELYQKHLETRIIDFAEHLIKDFKSKTKGPHA